MMISPPYVDFERRGIGPGKKMKPNRSRVRRLPMPVHDKRVDNDPRGP